MTDPLEANMIRLGLVAHARSGDKGNHANIGVVAYTPAGYKWLLAWLTAERVHDYFAGCGVTSVRRYDLPGLGALNFVLSDALAGGASRSPRIDSQAKLFSTALLEMPCPRPESFGEMVRPLNQISAG